MDLSVILQPGSEVLKILKSKFSFESVNVSSDIGLESDLSVLRRVLDILPHIPCTLHGVHLLN